MSKKEYGRLLRRIVLSFAVLCGIGSFAGIQQIINTAAPAVSLPTLSLIQHPRSVPCSGSGTTCAITLTGTTVLHNDLFFACNYTAAPTTMLSVDKGGTLIPVVSTQGNDSVNSSHPAGYIIDATAATTPITITFSTSTGGANCEMWEIHPSASSPALALDAANSIVYPSGVTPLGPGFTLTGGNDVLFQWCATANSCTAITSPYSSNADFSSGNGWAVALNQTTAAAPTWTLSGSGQTSLGAMAFGFSPTAFFNRTFIDWSGGSNNTSATEANMRASAKGYTGCVWSVVNGTALKYQTAAARALDAATGRLSDGASYAGSASLGLQYLTSTGNSDIGCTLNSATGVEFAHDFSAGTWITSDLPDADTSNMDIFAVFGTGGSDFANAKWLTGGAKRAFQLEVGAGHGGGGNSNITTDTGVSYWLTICYKLSGFHELYLYNTAHTQLGHITEQGPGSINPANVDWGKANAGAPTTGFVVNYGNSLLDLDGTCPLLAW